MKAQELRIGNIVLDDYSEEVYVISICKEGLEVSYSGDNDESTKYLDISEIHPLLITPELLEKAGFYNPDSQNVYSFNSKSLYVRTLQICNVINFHHLQNIIFDLTGEEITI